MNVDQQTRDQLRALTEDVVGGPDLGRALRDGRRQRRSRHRRTALTGLAVVAVTGVVAGSAYQHQHGPSTRQAVDGPSVAAQPSYHDFVAGTDLDETFQAAVAADLPSLGDASEVYPSDWNHDGPITGWADATDWQLNYAVDGERLSVVLGKQVPGSGSPGCRDSAGQDATGGQPACTLDDWAGGSVVSDSYRSVSDGLYVFTTTYVRVDGSQTSAQQRITADSWPDAVASATYSPAQLQALVTDPELQFPDPEHTPPPPANR